MRAWLALPLLTLAALPAMAATALDCDYVRDPAALPLPAEELAAFAAAGLDLSLAQPLGPAPLPVGVGLDDFLAAQEDTHACTGKIRPGAPLTIVGLGSCTANWVYQDETGAYYIGTAGHCLADLSRACAPVYYTDIRITGVGDIGDAVYSTGNCGVGNDFGLIKVDPALYRLVEPAMCHWSGPTSVSSSSDPGFVLGQKPLLHYGWGVGYGTNPATRPRVGFLPSNGWGQRSVQWEGFAGPGDSGSAVETSYGGAVGVLTHGLGLPVVPVGLMVVLGTRVDAGLATANQALGHQLHVVFSDRPVDLTGLSTPD